MGSVTLLLLLKLQESCLLPSGTITLCLVPCGTITLCHFIYPDNFDYPNTWAICCDQRGSDNRGSTVHVCRDGCWIMWPCYMECISLCAWHFLFLYLSASAFMHWAIPAWARFLFRNLFMETCFCFFFDKKSFNNLLHGATLVIAVDASLAHVCWQTASNSQYALPPQSSLQESASSKSQLRSK